MASSAHWIAARGASLDIEADAPLRTALMSWLRHYGQANGIPGLNSGSLEARLAQLRRMMRERDVLIWTNPARWAAGEGLTLRFPALGIDVECALANGVIKAEGLALTPLGEADPEREPGSVGVVVSVPQISFSLAPAEANGLVVSLEQHFVEHAVDRWAGFVKVLGQILEEEERDAHERRARIAFRYGAVAPGVRPGVWIVSDLEGGSPATFEPGEWVEIVRPGDATAVTARVLSLSSSPPVIELDSPTLRDPPRSGIIRPRPQDKILRQKQALIRQFANPTGDIAELVKLVAAPDLATAPTASREIAFVNPLVGRVPSQARAVALALGLEDGQALLIQGPPGTGKSTTAAEIDLQLIRRNPSVRILICSHSNHGTDNLLMKLLPFVSDPAQHVARVGAFDRVAPAAREFFTTDEATLASRNLVFTTIDSLGLQDIAGARMYDYVILDEANRAGILDSLLALARGKRYILVGDQMQLQPVLSEAAQRVSAQADGQTHAATIDTSLFAWLMERGFPSEATVLLDEQNRMHPAIAGVVSRVFYGGRVRTGPAAPHETLAITGLQSAVAWVDTTSLGVTQETRRGTSLVNVAEAELVTDLAQYLAKCAPPALSIGVITAYASQKDVIRRLLGSASISEDRQLEIDTVDAFEGREKDMIVLSLVRTNARGDIGFLRLEQRLNVAASRARRLLVVVGHVATLRGGYLEDLLDAVRDAGVLMQAADLRPSLSVN